MVTTPENLGQGILPIGAPPRERPVTPVLPGHKTEPAPTREPGKHPKEKTPSSKKALIARLAGSLLALTGIAGPAVNHHINYESELNPPAIGRDIASVPGFYWNLGNSTIEDIQRRFGFKETPVPSTFDNNVGTESEIPNQLPTAVPTVETPEITIPKSFTTTETTKDNGRGGTITTTTGIVVEGVNTTPLTEENLQSIIENNPDSYSPENRDSHVMTNKHIFIAVESDKPVIVTRSTGIIEVLYSDNDDGSNARLIRYLGAGATGLTFEGTGVLKLFTSNPVEIFQRPPWIVNGEEYLNDFFVVETLPDGGRLVYVVSLGDNVLTGYVRVDAWRPSDEFKNAPQATQLNNGERETSAIPDIRDAKNGIKAEMKVDENGNIISPDLLEIVTPGTQVNIYTLGNIDLVPYLTEENGDKKVAKPS